MEYATRHTHRRLEPLPEGWLTLNDTNDRLIRLSESGAAEVVAEFTPWEIHEQDETAVLGRQRGAAVHTSADGRFAAVVDDYGRHGVVVDLTAGRELFRLHRGEDHGWTVSFGVAFLPGDVLVAQTDWNRIDAFSLPGGELLTRREGPPEPSWDYRCFEYLGAVHASPGGRWLLVDGWAWSPVTDFSVVDVREWLDGDVPGPEWVGGLDFRHDTWDVPVAWLDEDTVAVQWLNSCSTAAKYTDVINADSGERVRQLHGVQGPMWGHGGKLWVSGSAGLEVWHPEHGRIHRRHEGIRPTAHNPATGGFAELADGMLRTFHPASGVVSTPIAHYGA